MRLLRKLASTFSILRHQIYFCFGFFLLSLFRLPPLRLHSFSSFFFFCWFLSNFFGLAISLLSYSFHHYTHTHIPPLANRLWLQLRLQLRVLFHFNGMMLKSRFLVEMLNDVHITLKVTHFLCLVLCVCVCCLVTNMYPSKVLTYSTCRIIEI